jgi:TorA maturation chaperone TorD
MSTSENNSMTAPVDEIEQARAAIYRLLGVTLSHPPTGRLVDHFRNLPPGGSDSPVATAFSQVSSAARNVTLEAARREYDALFVGIARGELVPYASFYLTGFLHDRPLMRLREDLREFGLIAAPEHPDPEDHAGTICELMALLIDGAGGTPHPVPTQRRFFTRHMAPWIGRFFAELETAEAARFYAPVGHLGRVFFEVEREAFQMELS